LKERSPAEHRLPMGVAVGLPASVREALEHPLRRHLLRLLNGDGRRLNPAEAAASELWPCSASGAGYHMRALAQPGLIRDEGAEQSGGSARHYFSATPASEAVLCALRATEEGDARFLAHARHEAAVARSRLAGAEGPIAIPGEG